MCSQTLFSRNVRQKGLQTDTISFWRIGQMIYGRRDRRTDLQTPSSDFETASVPPRCCLLVSDNINSRGGLSSRLFHSSSGALSLWSIWIDLPCFLGVAIGIALRHFHHSFIFRGTLSLVNMDCPCMLFRGSRRNCSLPFSSFFHVGLLTSMESNIGSFRIPLEM